ncbi:hypothetical protein BJ085DRAFT_40791 [Dimargaris cristalligena]|uniref:Uncharacterized protein n=1 Tax=Dimargaris cristalligena TaxID=215637 RepID=A0A4P9ZY11_9FUNG|nr:hypothetical protein BJ085DRAFT_40791 [Dimargaris cristalligena]|eukprot:RKP38258.1 hypothetical protein BJ085DRAFT_40791 [Dimargaris cristalligena]
MPNGNSGMKTQITFSFLALMAVSVQATSFGPMPDAKKYGIHGNPSDGAGYQQPSVSDYNDYPGANEEVNGAWGGDTWNSADNN